MDIAAHGVAISSALSDGALIHMSGTSMSAPEVSHFLTKIFVNNPSLSAEEGIQELYTKYTVTDPRLDVVVANGRRLQLELDSENSSLKAAPTEKIKFDTSKVINRSPFLQAVVANFKAITGTTLQINIQNKILPVFQQLEPKFPVKFPVKIPTYNPVIFQCKDVF